MAIKLRYLTALLAAGSASAIIAAPAAAAASDDPQLTCTYASAGNSVCQSEGNAQLSATPPPVQYPTYYPWLDTAVIIHNHEGRR
jgi:hypothetical protein